MLIETCRIKPLEALQTYQSRLCQLQCMHRSREVKLLFACINSRKLFGNTSLLVISCEHIHVHVRVDVDKF